jgi:hypothetical protein
MRKLGWILCLAVVSSCLAAADEGHQHHEELTQEQLGTVHFPVSCTPEAQKTFEKGVALLHSFWYEEAEKAFVAVQQQDPKCVMSAWGQAMSLWHQLWNRPDSATIGRAEAILRKADATPAPTDRERLYIDAIEAFYSNSDKRDHPARAQAYSAAMEKLYEKYPDDHEAAAFYALSLLASEPEHDTTLANRRKAGPILEKLFAIEPNHPGVAHYLIHTYDKPQLAELGLPAARRYAQIAPVAPHAVHMPSHIFARLGMWQEDINSNLASIAATRRSTAMHMGGAGHQFHAMDFLVYAYLQSGHEAGALKVIDEVKAMPEMHGMNGAGYDTRTWAIATFQARYELELHHWSEAASLALVPGADSVDNATTHWARAIGAARSANVKQARLDVQQIEAAHKAVLAKNDKDSDDAEAIENMQTQATAWLNYAEGEQDAALAAMRSLAEKEEAFGGEAGRDIPAREMLADMLLGMKQGKQALSEYKASLKFAPKRFDSLYGAAQAAEMVGQPAGEYYGELVKVCEGSTSTRPELAKARQEAVAQK